MKWFYLSFADSRFLGGVLIQGVDEIDAVRETHRRGINPGGQVFMIEVPPDVMEREFPPEYRERLLSEAEVREKFGGKSLRERTEFQ